jgi:hypothetical protein
MRTHRRLRALLTPLLALSCLAAEKVFQLPEAQPAQSYPAHDAHTQEHAAVAADPYDTPQKNAIFHHDYFGQDLLPLFVVITNDNDLPLSLTGMTVELDLGHARIQPAGENDILRRMAHPHQPGPSKIPVPVPLPHRTDKKSQQISEELEQAQFHALAIEPHSTHGAFFFFDISGIDASLSGARLIVSGIRTGSGNELFYFEIPLEKAVSPAQQ